jgi:hypothetical protein
MLDQTVEGLGALKIVDILVEIISPIATHGRCEASSTYGSDKHMFYLWAGRLLAALS